mmetsp:Transcript_41695/g.131703  ORF Transcript_41695/g.131703 Transcript_41695/m.131703 type:complete len:210 (+) Transcript_41695:670-1299(+)
MIGCLASARPTALASIAETVTPLGLSCAYSASKSSVTICRETVYVGTLSAHAMFLTTAFCMPVIGTTPAGAGAAGAAELALAAGAAAAPAAAGDAAAFSTSSATMRPSGPVPTTVERSTPFDSASERAKGDATTRPPAGTAGAAVRLPLGAPSPPPPCFAERRRPRCCRCGRGCCRCGCVAASPSAPPGCGPSRSAARRGSPAPRAPAS